MSLRERLQPTIIHLTEAIDYYSEQNMRGKSGIEHYIRLVKIVEDIKLYIVEQERKDNEKLCVPSGSNGGLRDGTYDWVEELRSEDAREYGYHGA
jgi:hypothetical protein